MKIKQGYTLKHVVGKHLVVPIGSEAVNFSGIITLNDSGVILFESLQKGSNMETLIQLLIEHYDVDKSDAEKDIIEFLAKLKSKGLLE
jgi:hypothetical protein